MREIPFRIFNNIEKKMLLFEKDFIDTIEFYREKYFDSKNFILMKKSAYKDLNNKFIYDGDILEHKENYNKILIKYDKILDKFELIFDKNKSSIRVYDYYIIGNIYENPELLNYFIGIKKGKALF